MRKSEKDKTRNDPGTLRWCRQVVSLSVPVPFREKRERDRAWEFHTTGTVKWPSKATLRDTMIKHQTDSPGSWVLQGFGGHDFPYVNGGTDRVTQPSLWDPAAYGLH